MAKLRKDATPKPKRPAARPPQPMFSITTGGESYKVALHEPSTGYPRATCQDDTLHVRMASTAADLIDNLNAAAALAEGREKREVDFHDHLSLMEYVEQVHGLIEAVLPPFHPVAFLFGKCIASYTEESPPPLPMICEAIAAFDALADDEKRRIFNGWHVPGDRPMSSDLANPPADFLAYRMLRFNLGSDKPSVHFDYRNDDEAGVHPVRLLVTEGTSKRDVLANLRTLIDLVNAAWTELVAFPGESLSNPAAEAFFDGTFHQKFRDLRALTEAALTNKKGEASPRPTVPELGSIRNEKARKSMPAA